MRAASEGKGKSAESRIGFRVLEASSSDDGFEASALEHAHPQSQGWQSARFCDYPVSLILELERRLVAVLIPRTIIIIRIPSLTIWAIYFDNMIFQLSDK